MIQPRVKYVKGCWQIKTADLLIVGPLPDWCVRAYYVANYQREKESVIRARERVQWMLEESRLRQRLHEEARK